MKRYMQFHSMVSLLFILKVAVVVATATLCAFSVLVLRVFLISGSGFVVFVVSELVHPLSYRFITNVERLSYFP